MRRRILFYATAGLAGNLAGHGVNLLVSGAHGNRRYAPRRLQSYGGGRAEYDRSITTFSDDGRLLQVEYGMEASNRGGTVACIVVDVDNHTDVEETENKSSSSDKEDAKKTSVVCVAIANYSQRAARKTERSEESQEEIDVDSDEKTSTHLPGPMWPAADKLHRIDHHCILLTTGLGGDGRALAQSARVAAQRLRLMNGEVPTVAEVARDAVAKVQHELTRISGARPFGVTATLFGVDKVQTAGGKKQWAGRLFQSESGGILQEYNFCASGRGRKAALAALEQLHAELSQSISMEQKDLKQDSACERLEKAVCGVAKAVMNGDTDAKQVDIWLLEPLNNSDSKEYRGHCKIRWAEGVCENDLAEAAKSFVGLS